MFDRISSSRSSSSRKLSEPKLLSQEKNRKFKIATEQAASFGKIIYNSHFGEDIRSGYGKGKKIGKVVGSPIGILGGLVFEKKTFQSNKNFNKGYKKTVKPFAVIGGVVGSVAAVPKGILSTVKHAVKNGQK